MLEHEILSMDARDSLLFSMNKWIPHSYLLTSHKKLEIKTGRLMRMTVDKQGSKTKV